MTDGNLLAKFYINGNWVDPGPQAIRLAVENPATEEIVGEIAIGSAEDADHGVMAARAAFEGFSAMPVAERIALLKRVHEVYLDRAEELAGAIMMEMGAPISFAREAQVWAGDVHLAATIEAAERFHWEEARGSTLIRREAVGVVGLITPWNWPMNQIVCKVAPALAAGCTMVLKPSEIAPLSGVIFAEIMDEAGVPPGVFNLVNGDGPGVGARLSAHPEIDMVSFTGSTRAGVLVAQTAAPTVKRVAQELGGKSANIILPSADLEAAVVGGVEACMLNTGQSCDAPTRMFVPRPVHETALGMAKAMAERMRVGDPNDPETVLGPVVSRSQYDKIQGLIRAGVDEGSELVTGGLGRPEGMNRGHFVRPTVFGNVTPEMTIAREEIFGPVLAVLPCDDVDDAVAMANDSVYGLAAYVQGEIEEARAVARRLRAGQVQINYPDWDVFAPFGGYKQSGNGHEYADWGIHDFCELKGIIGYGAH
jgi:aldehyde dehydrogenase (NAD+)